MHILPQKHLVLTLEELGIFMKSVCQGLVSGRGVHVAVGGAPTAAAIL